MTRHIFNICVACLTPDYATIGFAHKIKWSRCRVDLRWSPKLLKTDSCDSTSCIWVASMGKKNCITQSYINTHLREEEGQFLRYHTWECKVHIWRRSSGMLCTRTCIHWLMEIDGVWHQIKCNIKYEKFKFHFIIGWHKDFITYDFFVFFFI